MNYRRRYVSALVLILSGGVLLYAQTPQTCTGDVVSVPTRPTFIGATDTTRCGVVEIGYGWYGQRLATGEFGNVAGGMFRLGIRPNFDVRWGADNLALLTTPSSTRRGTGDGYLGATYRFFDQSRHVPSLALSYSLKVPLASAAKGLGTGETDHSYALLASKDFGKYHVDINATELLAGRQTHNGFDRSTIAGAAVYRAVTGRLTGVTETYGGTALNASSPAFGSSFVALTYKISPRLVVDGGYGIGWTSGTPKRRVQLGLTYAIGNVYSALKRTR